jgi:hypothetical protein
MKDFWTIHFNDRVNKWIGSNADGRILDANTPSELLAQLPRTAGQDKSAEFRVVIEGR